MRVAIRAESRDAAEDGGAVDGGGWEGALGAGRWRVAFCIGSSDSVFLLTPNHCEQKQM